MVRSLAVTARSAAVVLFVSGVSLQAATYYVTVAGLGGSAEYETQFSKWASDMDHALRQNGSDTHVETIVGAGATRQRIESLFSHLQQDIKPEDAIALLLIGHGTFQ